MEPVKLGDEGSERDGSEGPSAGARRLGPLVAALLGLGVVGLAAYRIGATRPAVAVAAASEGWRGSVAEIARSGPPGAGAGAFLVTAEGKEPLAEGSRFGPGARVATDARTRARLAFDDGTVVVLDRATEVKVEEAPRTIGLDRGALLADVAHLEDAPPARVKTATADVKVIGTKLAVTAGGDRTNVEVLRGEVEVKGAGEARAITAGQEGVVGTDGRVDVAPANDLAQRTAFGERLLTTEDEDEDEPVRGLGELRAKRPGRTDEKDHAVRLARHGVKIRIAGNVARTEIDETFTNDTDDVLEGIYRFPLPAGAQIERLALEVDGELVEGEFIDKAKAAAIWRGAIHNAAPKAPPPREEIVWVPGPWHDPALLEWQRGGRFELRIFPIPKRGSRRVVIAYTETVAPTSGVRRYVYPLPQGSASDLVVDELTVDAQVLGQDPKTPVRVRGYDLERRVEGGAERLAATMRSFTPTGDLAIEYALEGDRTDATVWAYRAEVAAAAPRAKGEADPIGKDPFVAIALRPKLPRWSTTRPRDQVIVVDVGRTMYGERLVRARRLATQIVHEMDRRDRVTVLACDVTCRALPGGFVAPGGPSAHDVDAFLRGVTPDGASDLVGAVRAATSARGRDPERDLRVVLLSDGVATAGYRSPDRVATEVGEAVGARAEVVAVPIGSDADVKLLGEIARGGGGVVVPYQPGQRLASSALAVLNATYGTTLRDVELVLPEGLRDAAPAALAPLRAGSETIVTARMSGDGAKGDVVLRGNVGGERFEARYPIDVRAGSDAGNAFVPRLFAAARIVDRERSGADAARAELVALSRAFSVPSRATSLLVLESEAMFRAFGIERAAHGPQWAGETIAKGAFVEDSGKTEEREEPAEEPTSGLGAFAPRAMASDAYAGGGLGRASVAPTPTMAPPPPSKPAEAARKRAAADDAIDWPPPSPPRRGGRYMKRVYVRRGTVTAATLPASSVDRLAKARAALAAAPDARSKHKDLARALAATGDLDELGEVLERWSSRDPLDVDVIVARADLAARLGRRDASLRILGGALAADLPAKEAFEVAESVARSYERLGKSEACAFRQAAAELRPSDAGALARAVACARAEGRDDEAARWLSPLKDAQRAAVSRAVERGASSSSEGTGWGDVRVSATWSGDADLDLAILDPSGRRASAVSRLRGARVQGATSRDHEALALSSREAGAFLVEIARADGERGGAPVSGTVTITAFGQTRALPFTLTGARAQVGRVDVRWEAQLVPIEPDPVPLRPQPFGRPPLVAR